MSRLGAARAGTERATPTLLLLVGRTLFGEPAAKVAEFNELVGRQDFSDRELGSEPQTGKTGLRGLIFAKPCLDIHLVQNIGVNCHIKCAVCLAKPPNRLLQLRPLVRVYLFYLIDLLRRQAESG
ncbi:MAG TPA: hypothetical protein VLI65_07680 [Pyrinomonadaceae bacterium]|nr:hypothetical protein [Pyrinomonadaceae bacterium]